MKPAPLRYERAETIDDAVALLGEHGDEAKVLAGGQSLVPALNMRLLRPAVLVDIERVLDLDNIAGEEGVVRVGAMVRQADSRLGQHPLLAEAIPHVGHFVTRNRGTVCGSIAHADPAAELPLCLTLLGGSVRVASVRGEREIAASNFFVAPFTTALRPDELVVETIWPTARDGWGYAFAEFAQRRGDYAPAWWRRPPATVRCSLRWDPSPTALPSWTSIRSGRASRRPHRSSPGETSTRRLPT